MMEEVTESDSDYTKHGLELWLNNQPELSEQHFKAKIDSSSPIFAGYAFIICMNGVISYEMDKIEEAQNLLKELEHRCNIASQQVSWFTAVRTKLFGSSSSPAASDSKKPLLAQQIEEQIILADTFMSSAILTFLTSDLAGLVKGSWLLRKAWKIYQTTYNQLHEMFLEHFANDNVVLPPFPPNYPKSITRTTSQYTWTDNNIQPAGSCASQSQSATNRNAIVSSTTKSTICLKTIEDVDGTTTATATTNSSSTDSVNKKIEALKKCDQSTNALEFDECSPMNQIRNFTKTELLEKNNSSTEKLDNLNNNLNNPDGTITSSADSSDTAAANIIITSSATPTTTATKIANNNKPSKSSLCLNLDLENTPITKINGVACQVPLTCPEARTFNTKKSIENYIEPDTIKRLMGAISFGYGIFQLSASLLPVSLLRIISFFGFEGNRTMGISCLMYSRLSSDMRSTLSTLALLWFYTFGSQMFQHEDGYSTDEIVAASNLLNESEKIYSNSAIFLFFRGRVERMKANTAVAVSSYKTAYRFAAQKELRLLCLHELAWCKLIQLDFQNAMTRFDDLRAISIFSKAFYTYMTAICQAAAGNYENLITFKQELTTLIAKSQQKDSQISTFVEHRIKHFPSNANEPQNQYYWKYLVYEVLLLWNALSNVGPDDLKIIIADCTVGEELYKEPMVGMQKLILAGALVSIKTYPVAVTAYRECIARRDKIAEDAHISVFAHYELAMLLLQCKDDYTQDAKKLLQDATVYRNYDLENRLSVHIHKELKKLG